MTRVLIVDDDPDELRHTASVAAGLGHTVLTASGGDAALEMLRADPLIAAVLLDLVMPDRDGMAVLETLARRGDAAPVLVTIADPTPELVGSVLRAGAADYVDKPVAPERLLASLGNARRQAALEIAVRSGRNRAPLPGVAEIVSASPAMARVRAICSKASRSPLPLLIEGEPGSGRRHIARVVHDIGDRAGRPFVSFDCAAAPASEVETLLFGAAHPAREHPGRFVEAQGGTLLLHELGELSPATQAAVLRAIETGEIRPAGASRSRRVNVRVIASSSRRLLNLARSGELHPGLYNQFNVLSLYLPPLRDRREDLAPLARHFIARLAAEAGRRITGIAPQALAAFDAYGWPGNLREFEAALHRAIVLARSTMLELADFPQLMAAIGGRDSAVDAIRNLAAPSAPVHIDRAISGPRQTEAAGPPPDRFLTRSGEVTPLADLERELIVFALGKHGGRMSLIARALGIGRSTLYRKLRDYGLEGVVEADVA